jgi:hypothetical protein
VIWDGTGTGRGGGSLSSRIKKRMWYTNLLIDRVALSKHDVTPEQPREKGIMRSRLATVQLPLDEQE